MNKKKILPILYASIFAVSFILLSMSMVDGVRATLVDTETFENTLDTHYIGVELKENDVSVAKKYYDKDSATWDGSSSAILTAATKDLIIGKRYDGSFTVTNCGEIDEFVRVIVYRYWTKDSKKVTDLDPTFINLEFNDNKTENGKWIVDSSMSSDNKERTVLYYSKALKSGETTGSFLDSFSISNDIKNKYVPQSDGTYLYRYDGYSFEIEIEVDGVQKAHADEAVKSAWGSRNLSITDDTLEVK